MPKLHIFISTKLVSRALAAVFGLILIQPAQAEGLSGGFSHAASSESSSIVSIRTGGGSTTRGVSAWHIAPRQRETQQLAAKAKIIDVRAALSHAACAYQNGVCIVRLHPDGTL